MTDPEAPTLLKHMPKTDVQLLLACDDSEAALRACRLVAAYKGARSRLAVTLLNVQRPPLRVSAEPGVEQAVLEAALRKEGLHQLEPGLSVLRAAGLDPCTLVSVGPSADRILRAARDQRADLLVMGGGRRGMLGGYAIGSVALRVAPAAPCPVLLVMPHARIPVELGARLRVVAPVDGSDVSERAIRHLIACAPALGTVHVDIVHFHPGLTLAAAVMPPHDDVLAEWSGRTSDEALRASCDLLSTAGISYEAHRVIGDAGPGIARFANERSADLIAMGTRGGGAVHHLVLGSVALETAQLSDVPLALLR